MARLVWVIATVLAVLLAGGYFLDKTWRSKDETTPIAAVISDKSIAVLPFMDMSEKKDQEYFADGMAEEIIDLLVKSSGTQSHQPYLVVSIQGQNRRFAQHRHAARRGLCAGGKRTKSGDRLRVTAQLIDSRDGTHLWSQTYDRDLSDVLKMQDEIAAIAVVRALQIEVSAGGFVSRPALRNTEAYTLYLQGLHAFDRTDQQGFEEAAK